MALVKARRVAHDEGGCIDRRRRGRVGRHQARQLHHCRPDHARIADQLEHHVLREDPPAPAPVNLSAPRSRPPPTASRRSRWKQGRRGAGDAPTGARRTVRTLSPPLARAVRGRRQRAFDVGRTRRILRSGSRGAQPHLIELRPESVPGRWSYDLRASPNTPELAAIVAVDDDFYGAFVLPPASVCSTTGLSFLKVQALRSIRWSKMSAQRSDLGGYEMQVPSPPDVALGQCDEDLARLGETLKARTGDVLSLTVERTSGPGHEVDALVQESFERISRSSTLAVARWISGEGMATAIEAGKETWEIFGELAAHRAASLNEVTWRCFWWRNVMAEVLQESAD